MIDRHAKRAPIFSSASRFLVLASSVSLGLVIEIGCGTRTEDDVASASSPLDLSGFSCGVTGQTSVAGRGSATIAAPYDFDSRYDCEGFGCPDKTAEAIAQAEADALPKCEAAAQQNSCPAGCSPVVTPTGDVFSSSVPPPVGCEVAHALSGISQQQDKSKLNACAVNAQGRWQMTCTTTAFASAFGTYNVVCKANDAGAAESGSGTGSGSDRGSGTGSGSSSGTSSGSGSGSGS